MRYGLLKGTKPSVLHPDEKSAYTKHEGQAEPTEADGYEAEAWSTLDDLYRGGMLIESKNKKYLKKTSREHDDHYKDRLNCAAFIGYLAQNINAYTAALFAQPVHIVPAGDAADPNTPGTVPEPELYEAFSKNADLRGSPFSQVLAEVAKDALLKRKGILALDFPHTEGQPQTRADSDQMGTDRPYVYRVAPEELIDWEIEEEVQRVVDLGEDGRGGSAKVAFAVGRFSWAILRKVSCRRTTPDEPRGATVEEYRVWRRDPESGKVSWELYRVEQSQDKKVNDDADVSPEDQGSTPFKEIPLIELRLPDPLWLGNALGSLQLEHWRRRSELLAAQRRALLVVPLVKLGPEIPGVGGPIPSEVSQNPQRGDDPRAQLERKGYMVVGTQDDLDFKGPPTAAFSIVDQQLKDLVDEMFRVAGRMAGSISSTSQALGRSGASKEMDNLDFVIVLRALGAIVRHAAVRAYDLISAARGEDIVWVCRGLDQFEAQEDRAALLDEGLKLVELPVRSPTFRREATLRWVNRFLPGLPPATMETIRAEEEEADNRKPGGRIQVTPTAMEQCFRASEVRADNGVDAFGDERDDMTPGELAARAQSMAMGGSAGIPGRAPARPRPAKPPPPAPTPRQVAKPAARPAPPAPAARRPLPPAKPAARPGQESAPAKPAAPPAAGGAPPAPAPAPGGNAA